MRADDKDAILRLHEHSDVWQVFGDDPAAVADSAVAFLNTFVDRDPAAGEAPWAIELDTDLTDQAGRPPAGIVGVVGLWPMGVEPPFAHRADPCIEIGWRLARPWWGQGLVTEAAATCLAHGRDTLGLPEVVAFTSEGNLRSQAVMVRLGMLPDPDADFDHPRLSVDDPRRHHVVYRTNW